MLHPTHPRGSGHIAGHRRKCMSLSSWVYHISTCSTNNIPLKHFWNTLCWIIPLCQTIWNKCLFEQSFKQFYFCSWPERSTLFVIVNTCLLWVYQEKKESDLVNSMANIMSIDAFSMSFWNKKYVLLYSLKVHVNLNLIKTISFCRQDAKRIVKNVGKAFP